MVGRRTSEDRLNRPKTVYFRLPASTYAYIRPLSREERRKNGGNRPQSGRKRPLSSRDRPFSASLGRTTREDRSLAREKRVSTGPLPGLCRVPAGTCANFRILALRKRVDRARNVRESSPRHGPLVGTQSGQKKGAIGGDSGRQSGRSKN